jgi:Cu(I)/Ag(I) efflux system membrane fusion protein
MKTRSLVFSFIVLFLGIGIGAGAEHWRGSSKAPSPLMAITPKSPPKQRILYWRNPMNPSIHADHPMKDNMGMDYLPVFSSPASSPGTSVRVSPEIRQTLGIRLATVKRRTFTRTVRAAATVAFDEHRIRVIAPRFSGWIRTLNVQSEGEIVRKGEAIAEIYSPELANSEYEARIALLALRSDPGSADNQKIWKAAQERLTLLGVPEFEIRRLVKTGKPRSVIPVISAYSGIVTSIPARVGGEVSPKNPLMTLADTKKLWVNVFFYNPELAWVKNGDAVVLRLASPSSRIYRGTLQFLNPEVGKTSRTIRARVTVPNPDGFLKAGMYLEATLHPDPHPDVLVIPREALIRTGSKTVVITETGEGLFRPARVKTGARSRHWVEVLGGLGEGERVVVSGQFLLDSESRFENVSARMSEGGRP